MGTKRRERQKAARQKAREQRRRTHADAGHETFARQPSQQQIAELMVMGALSAQQREDDDELESCVRLLAEGPGGAEGLRIVDQVIAGFLQRAVAHAWVHGWQPADVARMVERQFGARHRRMAVDAIAAQMRSYAATTVDERWEAQLDALGATVWWKRDDQYAGRWGDREDAARDAVVRCELEVLYVIDTLPEIPRLGPLPGTAHRSRRAADQRAGHAVDQRVLDRVRALLAKAESTEFAEEAEALTAKAQEFMARHSIDAALLAAGTDSRDEPVGCRVGIDRPYEATKALLLQTVAEANRCRVVWSKDLGFATMLGYPADLEAVELLYTSLLVQATTAVVSEGPRRNQYGQSRTRSFRQSFLHAYAVRIGQRLKAATEEVSRAAMSETGGDRLLPVLAAREDAVDEAVETMFTEVVKRRVQISDREGWASGTAAADLASLNIRQEVQ